jgi:hypothetical protein
MNNCTKITYTIVLATIGITGPIFGMDIFQAVTYKDVATINDLIAHIPAPQRFEYLSQQDAFGCTPLHYASSGCSANVATIKALLSALTEEQRLYYLCIQDNNNYTPLHYAIECGSAEITSTLLEAIPTCQRAIYLSIQNKDGNTPLHLTNFGNHEEIINMLIAAGAPLDIMNRDQLTPAQKLAQSGDSERAQLLDDYQGRIQGAAQQALALSQSQAFTLAQAFQSRLGNLSPAATLTPFLLHDIMKIAKQENVRDAELSARAPRHK